MVNNNRITRAISWSAADALVRNGFNFAVLIFLARILSPEDFGLVAMLALFVAIGNLLVDSGFGQALIQRQQTTHVDESTVFYFTLMMGGVMALALCVAAPWIAGFYGQPILEPMSYWMALNIFFRSLTTIHTTLLCKELDFKTITKASIVAALISGIVAIYMAKHGWGVWSLVAQVLVATLVKMAMLWLLHSWRPIRAFSVASLHSFFKFGGYLLWESLLSTIHSNLSSLLIGKMHSVQDVGYFSQAYRLQELPVMVMTSVVGRVAFPAFSAVAEDKAKLARGMEKAITLVMFVNIPLMIWLMILAEPLITLVLGIKWGPSAPILQVLTVVGILWPLNSLNINVLKAQGQAALIARVQILKLSISITLLFVCSPYGIMAIAYGQAVASLINMFANAHYTKAFLNYGALAQIKSLKPTLAAGLVMALAMLVVHWSWEWTTHGEVVVSSFIGGLVYLLSCKVFKVVAWDDLVMILRKKKKTADPVVSRSDDDV